MLRSGFSSLPKMPQLLRSGDVDLRIAAGEVIALLYELGRDQNEVSGGVAGGGGGWGRGGR